MHAKVGLSCLIGGAYSPRCSRGFPGPCFLVSKLKPCICNGLHQVLMGSKWLRKFNLLKAISQALFKIMQRNSDDMISQEYCKSVLDLCASFASNMTPWFEEHTITELSHPLMVLWLRCYHFFYYHHNQKWAVLFDKKSLLYCPHLVIYVLNQNSTIKLSSDPLHQWSKWD